MTETTPAAATPDRNPRLDRLTLSLEAHAASTGWDQPPRLYALVETADLMRREPQLARNLDQGAGDDDAGDLTPVDQGDLPEHESLDELLSNIAWPPEVLGTAIAVERLMVPPAVEQEMPQQEDAALDWLATHPARQEVRLVVAVLRDGSRSCALRMRAYDHEQSVLTGRDLVPGLADALEGTLSD